MSSIRSFAILGACLASVACSDDATDAMNPPAESTGNLSPTAGAPGASAGGQGTDTGGSAASGGAPGGAPATGGSAGSAAAPAELDPQVPPGDAAMMVEWLAAWSAQNWEAEWSCEAEPTAKTDGVADIHVHNDADGKNRVCNNKALAAAKLEAGGQLPVGAAAVKFVGDDKIFVEVKVAADSDAGKGWYWYGPEGMPAATGFAGCTDCHSAAGADADHPGFGDYVYFQVGAAAGDGGLDPQVPPADAAMMAEWLTAWADNKWEDEWVCEAEPTAKTEGIAGIHVHNDANGMNRVCSNMALAAAAAGATLPVGAAAVKYVGEDIYVEVKVAADSDGGNGWYWYAPGGSPEGTGVADCTGCHGQAGADADHPGFGDYVYFQATK